MEKKTIGSLIAALRKANGMTQRELAERLGVSDKSVSRWERDDGLPDLTLIPVLAEIFGVTCDELLRGERTAPQARDSAVPSEKGERQKKLLIAQSLRRFQNRSWIAAGIAAAGLLAAAVVNLGFLRAYIGFFLGAAFYLAAAVCESIWVGSARFAASAEDAAEDVLLPYRQQVQRRAEGVFVWIAALLGLTVPLLFVDDAYLGLQGESWLLCGLITGAIAVLAAAVVLYGVHGAQYRRGAYPLPESSSAAFLHNRRWKRICALLLLGIGAATILLHVALTQIWGPCSMMKGTTFTNYEDFVAFMETEVPAETIGPDAPAMESSCAPTAYYDESGNEITEEEALRSALEFPDGTVACEYLARNASVISIRYTPKEDTLLPITVCTLEDLKEAQRAAAIRHVIFTGVYCAELAGVLLLYCKKRHR